MARRTRDTERPARGRPIGEEAKRATSTARETAESTAQGAGEATGATAAATAEVAEAALDATKEVATTAVGAARDSLTSGAAAGGEGLIKQVLAAAREAAAEVLAREARAAAKQAAEILVARAPDIAREQMARRGGSDATARAAFEFGKAKLEGAGGTKAITSAAVGALKEGAGGLRTKVTDAIGGDETGEESEKGSSRLPVEVSMDIGVPRQIVWDEWTRFEDSPPALHRIQESNEGTLTVTAKVWGMSHEEEVEITEQTAEERLAWRANGTLAYQGVASFHELADNLTRLLVTLEFEPQGILQRLGSGNRLIERAIEADVKRFKADLETRSDEDEDHVGYEGGEAEDEPELAAEEEPDVDGEIMDEGEQEAEAEPDDEVPEAEVADAEEETEEPEAEEPEAEDEEDDEPEAPKPARRRQPAAATRSRRGGDSGSGGGRGSSGGGRPASASRAKSTSAKSTSARSAPAPRSGGRKGAQSAQSKPPSRSGGSRRRSGSRGG